MGKRAQATLFVTIGIVLLLVAGFVIFMTRQVDHESAVDYDEDVLSVRKYAESCLESSVRQSVRLLFQNGFFYEMPFNSAYYTYEVPTGHISAPEVRTVRAPYFLFGDASLIPSESEMKQNFERLIEESLYSCFDTAKFKDFEVEVQAPEASAEMGAATIIAVKFPIQLRSLGSIKNTEDFAYTLNYDIISKYEFVRDFVEPGQIVQAVGVLGQTSASTRYVPVGELASYAYDNRYNFEMVRISNDDVGFRIFYNDYTEPLALNFINRY